MPKRNTKRLVIDASVARAAGGVDAVKPQPKSCRDFLITVKESGHRFMLTNEIRAEWNRHQSNFAREWRSSMVAKKQVSFIQEDALPDLTEAIDALPITDKQMNAMSKDALLAKSAIAADKRIVALDNIVRDLFAKASVTIKELKRLSG